MSVHGGVGGLGVPGLMGGVPGPREVCSGGVPGLRGYLVPGGAWSWGSAPGRGLLQGGGGCLVPGGLPPGGLYPSMH